jgi:hypothetical protein
MDSGGFLMTNEPYNVFVNSNIGYSVLLGSHDSYDEAIHAVRKLQANHNNTFFYIRHNGSYVYEGKYEEGSVTTDWKADGF